MPPVPFVADDWQLSEASAPGPAAWKFLFECYEQPHKMTIGGSRVHGIWGTPARLRIPRGARSGQPFTAASRASAAV